MTERRRGSVVIPAHNEAAVIGRCLAALLDGVPDGALDVLVVCNGCTDDTADVARATGLPVRVLEIGEASKITALRVADAVPPVFPRLYLDADVVLSGKAALTVLDRLASPGMLAARPPLAYDTTACSRPVRRYYAARVLVPGLLGRLWGAGVYGLSMPGRARFGSWPDVVADDLFVDSLFGDDEIEIVPTDPVLVSVPRTARDLLAVLRRGARAKTETRQDGDGAASRLRHPLSATLRGLAGTAVRRPTMVLDVGVYAAFALGGRVLRSVGGSSRWERDTSSRTLG